jgi:hypothetical protein
MEKKIGIQGDYTQMSLYFPTIFQTVEDKGKIMSINL